MRPTDQVHVLLVSAAQSHPPCTHMCRQERIDHALAVTERNASFVVLPVERRIRWVGPHQVVEQPIVRYICASATVAIYDHSAHAPVGRCIRRISSMLFRLGESPPCTQNIFDATMEAIGSALNTSMNVFHVLMFVRRLHSS